MTKIIIRNYLHKDLLEKTRTKYEEYDIYGENNLYGGWLLEKLFFKDEIHHEYDYVCFFDEDCIVDNIDKILDMMESSDVDIVGVPDGNSVHMRTHRPDIPNMFFVIIKTKKLQNLDYNSYINHTVNNGYIGDTFGFNNVEPYYKFFSYLINDLSCVFFQLNAKTSKLDNETTEVFFDGKMIAAHTWWSRRYDDFNIKKRIDKSIEYYKNILYNKITLPFDKIYCLHCVEAKNRENNFKKELNKIGLTEQVDIWWSCKHPKALECANFLKESNQYSWNGVGNGGAFNCTREQYQIIKTAYFRGYNSVCVIEDDITFIEDTNLLKSVFSSIPEDYDILRLVYIYDNHDNKGDYFVENYTKYLWGAQMYALSRKGMKFYIDFVDNNYCVADEPLFAIDKIKENNLKNYFCNYKIAIIDNKVNNMSLIQSTNNNYNNTCVVELTGRLGNQLFQLSSAYEYAENHNMILYVHLSHEYWKKYYDTYNELHVFEEYNGEKEGFFHIYEKKTEQCHQNQIEFQDNTNIWLHGYWENEDLFPNRLFVKKFILPDENIINKIKQKYPDIETSVGISIRLGDFLDKNNAQYHLAPTIDWYVKTYKKYFTGKKAIVFSDDIEECKKYFKDLENIEFYETTASKDDMYMINNPMANLYTLALCKHHICSNSTFSWWGAVLMEKPDSINIFPDKRFTSDSGLYEEDYIPERFIKEKATYYSDNESQQEMMLSNVNLSWKDFDKLSIDKYYNGNKHDSLLYSFIARELNPNDKRLENNLKIILNNITNNDIGPQKYLFKHLIFYWYIPEYFWHDIYDTHIEYLKKYNNVFDKITFALSLDDVNNTELIEKTKQKLTNNVQCSKIKFLICQNDKDLRESKYFYEKIVSKLDCFGNDAIFFAHNKGVSSTYVSHDELISWIKQMYDVNLDTNNIDKFINNEDIYCCGTRKITNSFPEWFGVHKYGWHFSGAFFWLKPYNIFEYMQKHDVALPQNQRYFTEGFLGNVFPEESKHVLTI